MIQNCAQEIRERKAHSEMALYSNSDRTLYSKVLMVFGSSMYIVKQKCLIRMPIRWQIQPSQLVREIHGSFVILI